MSSAHRTRGIVYGITLFFITLTGFAQMPIFKRYYIADIPGLGWLAQFYVTHVMHYMFAAVLIALCFYGVLDLFLSQKGLARVTTSGLVKAGILLGLVVSGGFMVVKNLAGVYFPHAMIILLDLSHLGLCMALLMASAYTLIKKRSWLK